MSDSNELALTSQAVVPQEESLLSVIAKVASDPRGANVEVMERLLAMQERINEIARKTAYEAALARVQMRIPHINKDGRITVKGEIRSRFATLENIDNVIRPILSEEGFALSFDTDMTVPSRIGIAGKLSHREGHSEVKHVYLPVDDSGSKNGVQGVGSTVSYGRRMLIKMFFNIVEKGEDDDANGGSKPISQEDADSMRDMLTEYKANLQGFLNYMGVQKLEDILQRDKEKAMAALASKARNARS